MSAPAPSQTVPVQTVLVTGASRGLGLEFVRQYAADGWRVIACCRSPQRADGLKALARTNPSVSIETLDVINDKDIAVLATKLRNTGLDLLINCAGIFSGTGVDGAHFQENGADKTQTFGSLDAAGWMTVLRANAVAPIMIAQAFQNNLAQKENAKLVFISSRMGSIHRLSREGDIAYRSSKAALNAAMKSVSITLKNKKTIVTSFHPGWVQTDMGGKDADLTPEQSVTAMRRAIASLTPSNAGQFINYDGQILPW